MNPSKPEFIKFNNKIYYNGYYNGGYELFSTDGNSATLVKDLSDSYFDSKPTNFLVSNGVLYFTTEDNTKIWKSDGTTEGTTLIKQFLVGSIKSNLYAVNGFILFAHEEPTYGLELWKTDGTEIGTSLVKDINNGANSSYLSNLVILNEYLYFNAYDGSVNKIFKSDGSYSNTREFSHIKSINKPVVFKNKIYYFSNEYDNGPYYLWVTDGASAPSKIKEFSYNVLNISSVILKNVNDKFLVFDILKNESTQELWLSDGINTNMVKVLRTKSISEYNSNIKEYVFTNNKLFFAVNDGISGKELWVWDFNCPEFLSIIEPISQNTDLIVNQYIIGSNSIYPGVKVNYNANKFIVLNPGFQAQFGSTFTSNLTGCTNTN